MFLTLISGLFGGVLRLAPEILKFLDARNDRAHELAMQDKQLAFQQLQGQQQLQVIQAQGAIDVQKAEAQYETDHLQALQTAFTTQAQMAQSAGGFAAALNALVRPVVTFYVFVMWGLYHIATVILSLHDNSFQSIVNALVSTWTDNDQQLLTMIVSFYFVGRAIEKKGS